jgi:hypothetical protein
VTQSAPLAAPSRDGYPRPVHMENVDVGEAVDDGARFGGGKRGAMTLTEDEGFGMAGGLRTRGRGLFIGCLMGVVGTEWLWRSARGAMWTLSRRPTGDQGASDKVDAEWAAGMERCARSEGYLLACTLSARK